MPTHSANQLAQWRIPAAGGQHSCTWTKYKGIKVKTNICSEKETQKVLQQFLTFWSKTANMLRCQANQLCFRRQKGNVFSLLRVSYFLFSLFKSENAEHILISVCCLWAPSCVCWLHSEPGTASCRTTGQKNLHWKWAISAALVQCRKRDVFVFYHSILNKWNETWNCRNSVVALQDHCSHKAPTTNHHIKQTNTRFCVGLMQSSKHPVPTHHTSVGLTPSELTSQFLVLFSLKP